jgi:hypothetical protein
MVDNCLVDFIASKVSYHGNMLEYNDNKGNKNRGYPSKRNGIFQCNTNRTAIPEKIFCRVDMTCPTNSFYLPISDMKI